MHERACVFFQDQLQRPEGAGAREYLAGRGLTEQVVRDFRIGYAPDSGFLLRDRLKGFFDEDALKGSGLFSWKEKDDASAQTTGSRQPQRGAQAMYSKFRDRIIFPICNDAGKVIAFTGRRLSADDKVGPKYLNSPETPIYSKSRVLFNLDKAKEAIRKVDAAGGYAILVEGQMDCISVYAAGFHNVIASSGTAFTEPQARLLARFSKNVVVNFDPDTAGAAATERTLELLVREDFNIKVLTLESGLDPDLFIRRRGAQGYAEALRRSQKYFDYLIERAQAQFPSRTPEAKVKALNYLLPHIQRVNSRIVRDELAADISQKLGIESSVLRQELKQVAGARSGTVKVPVNAQPTDAERIIIRVLAPGGASNAGLRLQVEEALHAEALHRGLATEALIETLLAAGASANDPAELEISDSDRRTLASILLNEDEELTSELVANGLEALRRRGLERRQRDIRSQIAAAERQQDAATLATLMQEKLRIDRALSNHRA
jgi:DNA primase